MSTMGRIFLVALFLALGVSAQAQIIFSEPFDFPKDGGLVDCALLTMTSPYYPQVNQNLGSPSWISAATSAFRAPVLVETGALTYTGYALTGMGKKVYLPSSDSSRQSARRQFAPQATKVYYSMMVNIKEKFRLGTPYNGVLVDVSARDLNGTTIACVNSSTSSSGIRGLLVFNRADTTGGVNAAKIVAGVSYTRDDAATTFSTKLLDTLQTYLMVVCADQSTGTAKLWINPDLSGPEPAPDAVCVNANGRETLSFIYFTIYQRSEGPSGWIGGLRVGTSWGIVTNNADLPLIETFNYKSGALCDNLANLNATSPYYPLQANNVSGSIWINGSTSTNDDPLLVDSTGALTYTGYALSGVGKKLWCPNLAPNTSNNRASRMFNPVTAKVYYSALVNLPNPNDLSSSTSSTGEYLMGVYPNASFANANGRGLFVFRLSPTAGKYVVGVRASNAATAGWVAKDLDTAKTQLIVIGYQLSTGLAEIWVNPPISSSIPTPDATSSLGVAETNVNIGRFGVYQRGSKPHAYIGGVQVDTTWILKSSTGIREEKVNVATSFSLLGNYPNPFNPSTRIQFSVSQNARATLRIYNVLGQAVATIFDGEASSGRIYEVDFSGVGHSSGLYFVRLESAGKFLIHKMILAK
jgi:hypothetical protein